MGWSPWDYLEELMDERDLELEGIGEAESVTQAHDKDIESYLEGKVDSWNYYEASLADESRPSKRSVRKMRSKRALHYGQKRIRKEYNSRLKEEKEKRNKRLKAQNSEDAEEVRYTLNPRYRGARNEGKGTWYQVISKDEYKAGSSSRKPIDMLKEGNGIPFLPLSNTHASASLDDDITMEDDFKEEEEWIQDTRRKEYDQEAIRYIEEETYMSDTYSAGNSDIDIISSDGIVFKAHTVLLRQAS
jgi:hypothetical protein